MMLSTLLQCCIVIAMQIKLTVVVVVVASITQRTHANHEPNPNNDIISSNFSFSKPIESFTDIYFNTFSVISERP